MKNLKGWRTLGFNLLLILAPVALTYLASVNWTDYLNPTWAPVAVGVIGILLRFVTTSPVGKALLAFLIVAAAVSMLNAETANAQAINWGKGQKAVGTPVAKPAATAGATATPTPEQVIANLQSLTQADAAYAIALAKQANTPASNVRLQCWTAIAAALPVAPTGSTPPPDPHLMTSAEEIAELVDGLQPTSPLFVNCAGAAQLAQLSVLSFINAIVTGAAGIAVLAPKL